MNYQDYIKYDPEKKQYTDSYGYVVNGAHNLHIESSSSSSSTSITNPLSIPVSGTEGVIQVSGSSTDIDLTLKPKGGGITYTTKPVIVDNSTVSSTSNNGALVVTGGMGVVGAINSGGMIGSGFGHLEVNTTSGTAQAMTTGQTWVTMQEVLRNTFGSGYWLTNNTFKNISGKTMKVHVKSYARPTNIPAGQVGYTDMRVYLADGVTEKGKYGRKNWYFSGSTNLWDWGTTAMILLEANESFKWGINMSSGADMVIYSNTASTYLNDNPCLCITQIP